MRYLAKVSEEIIWEFYQPALEIAFSDESAQASLDEGAKESLKRISYKWMNQRVTKLESIVKGDNVSS